MAILGTMHDAGWKIRVALSYSRLPVAGALILYGVATMIFQEADLPGLGDLLTGIGCLVVGGVMVAPLIARVLAVPLSRIFYPGDHYDKPLPMYGIAETLRKQGDHQGAYEYYRNIVRDHPGEVKAYAAMVDIALIEWRNPELASSVVNEAGMVLVDAQDRDGLAQAYAMNLSRLQPPGPGGPDAGNGRKTQPLPVKRST